MNSRRLEHFLKFLIGLTLLVWFNILSSGWFVRIDLTEEKRYSIKEPTKELLQNLDDDLYIEVYLEGKLNAPFQRLQNSIAELLEEFELYSDHKLKYEFVDPGQAEGQQARNEFMMSLVRKGINPMNIIEESEGQRREHIIFPGAVIAYGGQEEGVMLLKGQRGEAAINQSIESLEYAFASAIKKLSDPESERIGLVRGHNEMDSLDLFSFRALLNEKYLVDEVRLDRDDLDLYNALIIAKPTEPYSDFEKYNLDQYIMSGGRVLFMIDMVHASMDSAANESNIALPYNLNLQDQLFRYGIRINQDLVLDNQAAQTPIVVGYVDEQPQIRMIPWPFFPLINRYGDHIISRNLDASFLRFANSIDTVKAEGVKKIPLMFTSDYSRRINAPVKVTINELRKEVRPESFNQRNIPVAYLLEGNFTSIYKNRFLPEGIDKDSFTKNGDSKLVVISDGDFARSYADPSSGQPLEVGYDPYLKNKFANEDFLMNAIAYLVEEQGIIQARSKEIRVRPLDKIKISETKAFWQMINLILPLVLLLVTGIIIYYFRKRRYAKF